MKRDARCCLSYWFPRLQQSGVPVPKTSFIETKVDLVHLMDGKKPEGYGAFIKQLRSMADQMGYPCFFRTGMGSNKHGWKDTCFLERPQDISQRVFNLAEWSLCVDIFGLPIDVWVMREFLPIEPKFHAFRGDMPVNRERRYFYVDGKVVAHFPYWHESAFAHHKKPDGWRKMTQEVNRETKKEVRELTALTHQAMKPFKGDGAWSLDWLWTKRGWYATDMGEAHRSWGCPEKLQQ